MKTVRTLEPSDRYRFDFQECRSKDGWAQIDTSQDASYYGNWANPFTLQIFSYVEGDVTRTTCDTPAEFADELRRMQGWTIGAGYTFAIDGMCNERIIDKFREYSLGDLLH